MARVQFGAMLPQIKRGWDETKAALGRPGARRSDAGRAGGAGGASAAALLRALVAGARRLLFWWTPRRAWRGQVLLLWLALDNLAKAALESRRDPPVAHLQWLSLAIGLASAAVLAARARQIQSPAGSSQPPIGARTL